MQEFINAASSELTRGFFSYVICVTRLLLPILALWILARCIRSMLRERYEPEIWAYLELPNGALSPLMHWECVAGRARMSDIVVNYPTVSRSHAALIRDDKGNWSVYDLESKGGVMVNSEPVPSGGREIEDGDTLALADVSLVFTALTEDERADAGSARTKPGRYIRPGTTFFILTLFITLIALQHSITADSEHSPAITLAFAAMCAVMWCYYLVMRSIRRTGFEVETIAFFLCTLGMSVTASASGGEITKQAALLAAGIAAFLILGWWLRDLDRALKMRWPAGFAALALLAVNLILAQEIFGARNWINLFGFTFQPSEFVKIAYIYAGTATLDRLHMGRNLFLYIAFSAACVAALALMGDFGTALIFFAVFLVISYMRSGNLATVFLAVAGAGLAGMLVMTVKPYIAKRFETWGRVWEFASEGGYQQTRALTAIASGGLFGKGAGNGWFSGIFAADTDLVFAVLCEELGLITAVTAVFAVIVLAAFAIRNAASGRSSFYVIASCAAVSLLMVQLALNVFGSVDILPFTGVTFPFVSRGGSSLISCWTLLAFLKAGDTRQNASFSVKLPSSRRRKREEYYEDDDSYESDNWDDEYPEDIE